MSEIELALAFLSGVVTGVLLDRWVLPPLVDAWIDRLADAYGYTFETTTTFIAPVYWMGLPAILKGWFERVFAYGFAYTLDRDGWNGHLDGRVPLLTQRKGSIITPTFFTQEEYDRGGWQQAIDAILCDWGFRWRG